MSFVLNFFKIILLVILFRSIIRFCIRKLQTFNLNNQQKDNIYKDQKGEKTTQKKEPESIEMVQDPICGEYIQKEKALKVMNKQHQTLYFCSADCKEKYVEQNEV